jgi:cytochrome d ubiquinol oxidase subunit II
VAAGNSMIGLPLDEAGEFVGQFRDMLNPYSLAVGGFTVALFAMHGSIYLYLKTEGEHQKAVHGWMWTTFGLFLVMYIFVTIMTLTLVPHATANFQQHPWAWIVVFLNVLAIANIPRAIYLGRPGYAFLSSCCTIAAFTFLFSIALFPNLVTSNPLPANSLTIYNAASSSKTLGIMLLIALIGMPCVLTYTAVIYWTFRGKVQMGEHSY